VHKRIAKVRIRQHGRIICFFRSELAQRFADRPAVLQLLVDGCAELLRTVVEYRPLRRDNTAPA
jgi:hypothetical protein